MFNNQRGRRIVFSCLAARNRITFLSLAEIAILAVGGGCIARNKASLTGFVSPKKSVTPKQVETPPQETKNDESLAAIEEFLERTSQYRAAEESARTGTPDPVVFDSQKNRDLISTPDGPERTAVPQKTSTANAQISIDAANNSTPPMPIPAILAVSIDSAEGDNRISRKPESNNATNEAMNVRLDPTRPTFDDLVVELSSQAEKEKNFDTQWRLRLAQLATGHDEDASKTGGDLPEDQATLLRNMINAAIAVRDAARDPLQTGETALATVENLRDALADRADPSVVFIAFCQKVSAFGVFEKMSSKEFVAGRKIQTIVYSEIRNLRAQRTPDDQFETRLSTQLEIYSDGGKIVWQREEPEIVDTCRQRRNDFFIAQRITLPATLPAGPYVLKVLVEDKLGGRATESTYDFEIFAPVSVASGP